MTRYYKGNALILNYYRLYKQPNIIQINRLRWVGIVLGMKDEDAVRKSMIEIPVEQRQRERPKNRFLDVV